MRKIKFRALCGGKWIYGGIINWANKTQIWDEEGNNFVVENPETVGQFTGLLDKNGILIYEGDIVEVFNFERNCEECAAIEEGTKNMHKDEDDCENYLCTQEVKFNCGWFCEENTGDYCPPLSEDYLELEIIGNIYENPEFLKETNNK